MVLTPEEQASIEERFEALEERNARLERLLRSGKAFTNNPLALATDLDDLGSVKTHLDFEEAPLTPVDPLADVLRMSAVDVSGTTGLRLTDSASVDTTIVARTRSAVISLTGFEAHTGSPTVSVGTNTLFWTFDADINEVIITQFVVPEDYVSGGAIRLYYTMASATSGVVRWSARVAAKKEGESIGTAGSTDIVNDTVQGTAINVGVLDITTSETLAAGDVLNIRVGRSGAEGADTATGNAHLHAVTLRYTAFF